MLFFHIILFFYLPSHGTYKLSGDEYCIIGPNGELVAEEGCNAFSENRSLIIFYLLCCVYFWISAIQVREGLPEVMQIYFMMSKYNWFNKAIFNFFMQIPFIFELRVFIDWTYTQTSLDVFQWIKLAQC